MPDIQTPPPTDTGFAAPTAAELAAATPMMRQYLDVKRRHPDHLVFYRMGDFYEMFFDDAVRASAALDIALTRRGQHAGADIPMCGVPAHSHDAYLSRLIRKGFKVAVCDQIEDPAEARKRAGAKALVNRDVVRVITPGTLTEDSLLDARAHNYLVALSEAQGALGLAWLDLSTGAFAAQGVDASGLPAALARLEPGEILVPDRLLAREEIAAGVADWKARLTPLPSSRFDSDNARRRLEALFGVAALDAFGSFSRAEIAACGALVEYVELTQAGRVPALSPPRRELARGTMAIDPATRRNLELTRALDGGREGTLLATIDRTLTGPGARLLAERVAAPLTDPAAIARRLDLVQMQIDAPALRESLRQRLKRVPDVERALLRLSVGRGGPRDLAALREGLNQAGEIAAVLSTTPPGLAAPADLAGIVAALDDHRTLVDGLTAALDDEPPLLARDGGFVRPGHRPDLDELRGLRDDSRRTIAALEATYRAATGVATLKIRHNNMIGYHVEISQANAGRFDVAAHGFIQRQSMSNATRYTTAQLTDIEGKIGRAADAALSLEMAVFEELTKTVMASAARVAGAGRALAELDVASALAELAVVERWTRPVVVEGTDFEIKGGRHPVVEAALRRQNSGGFVANDTMLGEGQRLWLLTGPNMAGKSTFLRQNALIAVLAQIGSWVPADSAQIGAIDRLFSRVGAADDLARGRSTFMVEMVETAAILNQATDRSLVILDEIGRGTATFDGLSIAWATLEHLHDVNRSRALFATHYHELGGLAGRLFSLKPWTMRVKEWQGDVVFLHEVMAGSADRSYGIHVAKLAGLPAGVVARATEVLSALEKSDQSGGAASRLADDLPLFAAAPARPSGTRVAAPVDSVVEKALEAINPDELTPRQALDALYELRRKLGPG